MLLAATVTMHGWAGATSLCCPLPGACSLCCLQDCMSPLSSLSTVTLKRFPPYPHLKENQLISTIKRQDLTCLFLSGGTCSSGSLGFLGLQFQHGAEEPV